MKRGYKLTTAERVYIRNYKRRWAAKRRALAVEALGGKCAHCSSTRRLEFDHIDPATKTVPSDRLRAARADVFWKEITKCQLLCHRCHIRKSRSEGDYSYSRTRPLAYAS